MSVVNMPEQTSGYQRKSQAIMNGTTAIGSTPPAALGPLLIDTTGEITAAQPVASIPFTGEAGVQYRAIVDGIPGGSTDFILTLKDPAGNVLQSIDTGTSPETVTQVLPTTGTYTYEISGFQGDLGDFTFKVQEVISSAVVLTAKDWGHEGGNQVQAEFRNPGAANQPLSVAVTGKLIEVVLGTDGTGALNSTAKQVVDAINANPAAAALVMATTYRGNRGRRHRPAPRAHEPLGLPQRSRERRAWSVPAAPVPHRRAP